MTSEIAKLLEQLGKGPGDGQPVVRLVEPPTPLSVDNASAFRAASMRSVPSAFMDCTFDDIETLSRRVKRPRAIELAERKMTTAGGLLFGHSGAGKTSLAVAVYRRFADQGCGLFVSAYALAKARAITPLGKGEADVINRAISAHFVVIDDLGSEVAFHNSAIQEVIYERHAAGKGTLVTTWLSSKELSDKYGDGIARRIVDRLPAVSCDAEAPSVKV